MSWPEIKKKLSYWSVIFSYSVQQQATVSQLDCDMWPKVDCIQLTQSWWWTGRPGMLLFMGSQRVRHDRLTELNWTELSGWTEKKLQSTSQSQACTNKRSWSLFGGLLPVLSTTDFWIPVKPLHLRNMLSKSMRCTENCNTCSWHWSTERAQFSTTMPDCTWHSQCFKSWTNQATKFCLICYIHLTSCQPITTSSSISTIFCRENASTNSRRPKMLSKSSSFKAQIFMLQE